MTSRGTPVAAIRQRPLVAAALLALAALAWWATSRRMSGMDAGPGTPLGGFGWFAVSWAVMMAAMMLPSFAPTTAAYSAMARARDPVRPLLFAAGYLLVWGVAGLAAYGLFEAGKSLVGGALAWEDAGRWVSAGVLVLAVVYQWSPLKRASLTACRGPVAALGRSWHDGRFGALRLGVRSGGWCLACSWAVMAALFALGVMSLTWMAVVAALVALEKMAPWRRAAVTATAIVLAGLAIALLLAPHDVPGLVVPSRHAAAMMGTMR